MNFKLLAVLATVVASNASPILHDPPNIPQCIPKACQRAIHDYHVHCIAQLKRQHHTKTITSQEDESCFHRAFQQLWAGRFPQCKPCGYFGGKINKHPVHGRGEDHDHDHDGKERVYQPWPPQPGFPAGGSPWSSIWFYNYLRDHGRVWDRDYYGNNWDRDHDRNDGSRAHDRNGQGRDQDRNDYRYPEHHSGEPEGHNTPPNRVGTPGNPNRPDNPGGPIDEYNPGPEHHDPHPGPGGDGHHGPRQNYGGDDHYGGNEQYGGGARPEPHPEPEHMNPLEAPAAVGPHPASGRVNPLRAPIGGAGHR